MIVFVGHEITEIFRSRRKNHSGEVLLPSPSEAERRRAASLCRMDRRRRHDARIQIGAARAAPAKARDARRASRARRRDADAFGASCAEIGVDSSERPRLRRKGNRHHSLCIQPQLRTCDLPFGKGAFVVMAALAFARPQRGLDPGDSVRGGARRRSGAACGCPQAGLSQPSGNPGRG